MITEPLTDPDHLEIRDVVVDFAEATFTSERVRTAATTPLGLDEIAWKQMVDLGWPGIGISESAGGAGLGSVAQCIVHRELGARLAPTPYLASAAFAATALGVLAPDHVAEPLLEAIADGSLRCALVLGHGTTWPGARPASIVARLDGSVWTLHGRAPLVLDGARARVLLVVAPDEEGAWHLFRVEAGDVDPVTVGTVDVTRAHAAIDFAGTPATPLSANPCAIDTVSTVVDRIAVYLAAEMIGTATSTMRQTLAYLKTRQQFGKTIGSFQALKHRCADTAVAITVAEELIFSAAGLIDADNAASLSVAAPLALARAGEVVKHASEEAIQLHGGVGFTDELDIGPYYKRALVDLEMIAVPSDAYARLDAVRARSTS